MTTLIDGRFYRLNKQVLLACAAPDGFGPEWMLFGRIPPPFAVDSRGRLMLWDEQCEKFDEPDRDTGNSVDDLELLPPLRDWFENDYSFWGDEWESFAEERCKANASVWDLKEEIWRANVALSESRKLKAGKRKQLVARRRAAVEALSVLRDAIFVDTAMLVSASLERATKWV